MYAMPIKAIVFDCFGVIYASPLKVFLDQIAEQHIRNDVLDFFHAYDRCLIEKEDLLQGISKTTGKPVDQLHQELFSGFKINPVLVAYIKELRKSYLVGMLTNVGAGVFEVIEPELSVLFDSIVPSYKVRMAKPDKAIYELSAQTLNVKPSECVFIDDQKKHCDGAVQAGMSSLLFTDVNKLRSDLDVLLNTNK